VRWAAYSLQLAIVNQTHMCVVALTASIAACNIKLVDEIFQPLGMNVTTEQQILVASAYQQRVFGESVCTT